MFKINFSNKCIKSSVFLLFALIISLFLGSYRFLIFDNDPVASLPIISNNIVIENLDNMNKDSEEMNKDSEEKSSNLVNKKVSLSAPAPAPASTQAPAPASKLNYSKVSDSPSAKNAPVSSPISSSVIKMSDKDVSDILKLYNETIN